MSEVGVLMTFEFHFALTDKEYFGRVVSDKATPECAPICQKSGIRFSPNNFINSTTPTKNENMAQEVSNHFCRLWPYLRVPLTSNKYKSTLAT